MIGRAVDGLGEAWLEWLVERSLVSTAALGVVLLALGALLAARRCGRGGGRLSAHLPSWLLLLPLVVLVVPLERVLPVPAPFSVSRILSWSDGSAIGAANRERADPGPPSRPEFGSALAMTTANPNAAASAAGTNRPTARPWLTGLGIGWLLLLVGGAGRLFWRQRTAVAALRHGASAPGADLAARFALLARQCGVRRPVDLRLVNGLDSPLTSGVRRPIVWLPSDVTSALTPTELHFALRHELAHVRRCDVALGAGVELLRAAFWFHPGFWLAAALHARWREFACDEAALAKTDVRRTDLAAALLTLLERASAAPAPALSHAHLMSERTFMKTRLLRILDPRFAARPRMSAAAIPVLLLTALGTVSLAQSSPPTATATENDRRPDRDAVGQALSEGARWLLQQQQEDGGWRVGPDPAGKNHRDHNSTCVTAMAILALLPAVREEPLPIVKVIQRGVKALEAQQQPNGRIGPDDPLAMNYAHAFALRALCAVQHELPTAARLDRIRLATEYCYHAQNPYSGWRYGVRDNDNDSKITSMMLLALHDAEELGIERKERSIKCGLMLLEQLTDPTTGRVGFVRRGEPMSRFVSKKADFPGELSEEPTALALLARTALQRDAMTKAGTRLGLGLIAALPPEWDREKGAIDLAYWHFGAEALALGAAGDAPLVTQPALDRWRNALHRALVPNRAVAGDAAYWPTVDAWSHPGMEVYTTASAMLALRALR